MESSGLSEKSQSEGAQSCPTCRNILKSSASLSSSGPGDAKEKEYDLHSQLKREMSNSQRLLEQKVELGIELQKSRLEVRLLNYKLSLQQAREKLHDDYALLKLQEEVRQLNEKLASAEREIGSQQQRFMHFKRQSQEELRKLEEAASSAASGYEEITKTRNRRHIMVASSGRRPEVPERTEVAQKTRRLRHFEAREEVRSEQNLNSDSTKLSDLGEKEEERATQADYSPTKKRGSQDNYNENVSKSESVRYDYWGAECNLWRAGEFAPTDQVSHSSNRECLQIECDISST